MGLRSVVSRRKQQISNYLACECQHCARLIRPLSLQRTRAAHRLLDRRLCAVLVANRRQVKGGGGGGDWGRKQAGEKVPPDV